jgi:peptidoglycan/xylan/chitin deacetylase (PgdA/CDA1 family)
MPTLPVLVYHQIGDVPAGARHACNYVPPAAFAAQLRLLHRAGFRSVSFREYLDYRRGSGSLPRRPIVISFDDGYRSVAEVAAPLLARFGFQATVFVVTSHIGGTNAWDIDERQEPLLDAADIRALSAQGIDFQSHTATHPRLTTLPKAEAFRELCDSRAALERLLGEQVSVVAYPWGDHDASTLSLAAEAGYRAGVVVRRRTNFDHTPLLALRRIGINGRTSLGRFAWDLARLRWRGD